MHRTQLACGLMIMAAVLGACGKDCPPGKTSVGGRCVPDPNAAASSGGTTDEMSPSTATGGQPAMGSAEASGGTDASGGSDTSCVPMGAEVCDGTDNDCDGKVDNGADLCATGEQCHEGACVDCISDSDCPDNTDACKVGACSAGTCGFQQAPAGSECRAGSVCTPTGSCVDCYGSGLEGAVGCDEGEGCYAGRCSKPACGNGIIEAPDEECDPAVTNDYHCDPTTCQLTGATVTAFQPCQTDDDCEKCTAVRPEFPNTAEGISAALAWLPEHCGGKEQCTDCSSGSASCVQQCVPISKTQAQDYCTWADSDSYTHVPVFPAYCLVDCSSTGAACATGTECVEFDQGQGQQFGCWFSR